MTLEFPANERALIGLNSLAKSYKPKVLHSIYYETPGTYRLFNRVECIFIQVSVIVDNLQQLTYEAPPAGLKHAAQTTVALFTFELVAITKSAT